MGWGGQGRGCVTAYLRQSEEGNSGQNNLVWGVCVHVSTSYLWVHTAGVIAMMTLCLDSGWHANNGRFYRTKTAISTLSLRKQEVLLLPTVTSFITPLFNTQAALELSNFKSHLVGVFCNFPHPPSLAETSLAQRRGSHDSDNRGTKKTGASAGQLSRSTYREAKWPLHGSLSPSLFQPPWLTSTPHWLLSRRRSCRTSLWG